MVRLRRVVVPSAHRDVRRNYLPIVLVAAILCFFVINRSKQLFLLQPQDAHSAGVSIFCFGDSLTEGMTAGTREFYPYAPHLERALDNNIKANVTYLGLSGWTTLQFVETLDTARGLAYNVQRQSPLDLVILLAGTNDLGRQYPAEDIQDRLETLVAKAREAGAKHVLLLGIPESRWQVGNPSAMAKARDINQHMRDKYLHIEQVTTISFPFRYNDTDPHERWSKDGLHLSPSGYRSLGETLAKTVRRIVT